MKGTWRTCPRRVDFPNTVFVLRLLGNRLEDAFGHGRPADVAKANEKNRHLLWHGRRNMRAKDC